MRGSTGRSSQVMSSSVDAADLYFQLSREESWALEDGIVKEGSASIEQGVGVRALAGEKTGFAYSDEIVLPALEEASRAARAIASRGDERAVQSVLPTSGHQLYLPIDPVSSFTSQRKGRLAGARRSRDPQDGSARRCRSWPAWSRCTKWCWSRTATDTWPPTCGRWCASTSR